MKKKRVYKLLYGVLSAMLSLQAEGKQNADCGEDCRNPIPAEGGGEFPAPASPVPEIEAEDEPVEEIAEEAAEEVADEAEEESEEETEATAEGASEEELDLRTPTADGLRFEWREGTRSYTVTGLAEENKEADKIMLPQELFGYPVTEVGESAFRGCRFLVEAVIPEGVTKIGDRAFYGCYALERIELPNSLQSVGDEVFCLCMAITSQTEFDNAYYLGNKNNPYVLLSVHKSREVDSCVIHRSTKFIDRGAFAECRTLERIEIPNGVLGIGCKAFYNCSALASVGMGSGVVHIGESAFYGCTALRGARFAGAREAWERIEIEENNEPLFPPALLS